MMLPAWSENRADIAGSRGAYQSLSKGPRLMNGTAHREVVHLRSSRRLGGQKHATQGGRQLAAVTGTSHHQPPSRLPRTACSCNARRGSSSEQLAAQEGKRGLQRARISGLGLCCMSVQGSTVSPHRFNPVCNHTAVSILGVQSPSPLTDRVWGDKKRGLTSRGCRAPCGRCSCRQSSPWRWRGTPAGCGSPHRMPPGRREACTTPIAQGWTKSETCQCQ